MTCPTCNKPAARLIIDRYGKACAGCRGLSDAAGVRVDGTLTRQSDRVRDQQRRYEGDMITPHTYDAASRSFKPNPDFIKHYPDRLAETYTKSELEKAGYSKADTIFKQHKEQKKAHERESNSGITYRGPLNKPLKPPV